MTDKARRDTVSAFARSLAKTEPTESGEFPASGLAALAEHLGCRVRDLTEDDIAWAEEAYTAALT